MTETWSYDKSGVLDQIVWAGVTGASYTGYTVTYVNGEPSSATYNNSMTETWSYNSSGLITQIVWTGASGTIAGQSYTSYTASYNAAGKVMEILYAGTTIERAYSYNSDGSYTITVTGITGEAYKSYVQSVNAMGQTVSIAYSDGAKEAYTHNSDGSYSILWTGVSGTVAGQSYTSYAASYNAAGKVTEILYAGTTIERAYSYNSNGSYSILWTGVSGTVAGQSYTSYTASYNSAGVIQLIIYTDSGGHEVARKTYTNGSNPVVTLGSADGDADHDDDIGLASVGVDVSTENLPLIAASYKVAAPQPLRARAQTNRFDDALLLGTITSPDSAAPATDHVFGPGPTRAEMTEAFFLAGIALPIAGLSAARARAERPRRSTLATFDPMTDCFEPVDGEVEDCDLPFVAGGEDLDMEADFL
jgi:hypothetical protein